ncbi:MAG: hypothetical protein J6X41_00595, partial [Spirochaetales bacterium]|nr:hypothetical protein [Spirochaetales bacterium]
NNSDNVLRAGLTQKHMDLDELERVMLHDSYIPVPMASSSDEGGTHFVCEGGFTLTAMKDGEFINHIGGPKTLICTEGTAEINGISLQKGQCCIAGSSVENLTVRADNASVFMATVN